MRGHWCFTVRMQQPTLLFTAGPEEVRAGTGEEVRAAGKGHLSAPLRMAATGSSLTLRRSGMLGMDCFTHVCIVENVRRNGEKSEQAAVICTGITCQVETQNVDAGCGSGC
ncbi:hypothetical protein SKAU_G00370820 [Synaphobranchus kaupii]|uniref:Uncharacterized protein n=1 Tax=Synaphobranchus kaupii TaxID=118154 RepID=A0A9Q1IFZ1_SYNKA|nr:hypothetical protein SKAU_G00370820 [Synaphobranchus kaupii]